jgi:tetratricopeptide (TPR) repeat protein
MSGGRLWAARLGLVVLTPVFLLTALEYGLRLAGWGYPTTFCLRQGSVYTDNQRYVCQFYSRETRKTNLRPIPFEVAVDKPAGTLRVVVLGESAAYGAPEPAYSFARILERMLRHHYPQRQIEVINAAMRGVNSHIILPTAKDCLCLHPDLFIVYMGNNEAIGLHAPGPHSGRFTPYRRILRLVQWIRSTRLGELMEPSLRSFNREGAASEVQDNAFFQEHRLSADDPRRKAVYDNFQANLADICRLAEQAKVKLVLATVADNLKDCPPFGALHRTTLSAADQARWESDFGQGVRAEAAGEVALARTNFVAAASLDDHFSELDYRIARCDFALGQFEQARQEYLLARDWDALQFRTDSRQNQIIRAQAASQPPSAVVFADVEKAFNDSNLADEHIPGERLFYDHVHFTFEGAYLVARTLLPGVIQALDLGQPSDATVLTREEVAQSLAFTKINAGQIAAAMLRLTARPPFTSQMEHDQRQAAASQKLQSEFGNLSNSDFDGGTATFKSAIAKAPQDWQLPYLYARTLLVPGRKFEEAIAQFETAERLLPHSVPIRLELSRALQSAGKPQEAIAQLKEVLLLEPDSDEARMGLAVLQNPVSRQAAR